jgi:hypothetical protein
MDAWMEREVAREQAAAATAAGQEAPTAAVESAAGGGGGAADLIPAHLLERSKAAKARRLGG